MNIIQVAVHTRSYAVLFDLLLLLLLPWGGGVRLVEAVGGEVENEQSSSSAAYPAAERCGKPTCRSGSCSRVVFVRKQVHLKAIFA